MKVLKFFENLKNYKQVILPIFFILGCTSAPPAPKDFSQNTQRIIGGIIEEGHQYVVGVGDDFGAFCTGTLLSKRTVITAGHCFGGISAVYFGTDLNENAIEVLEEVRHPEYNDFSLENDLALLKLAEDAPIHPALLLRETMNNGPDFIGPEFTFVGYGDTDALGNGFGIRRVVTLPIEAVGPGQVGGSAGFIDATQFYYTGSNKQTCFGDSGGPAFVIRNGLEFHAGGTSFGDDNCAIDGVQARTDGPQITTFIQATIDQFEENDPCRNDGVCNESCNLADTLVDPDCAENHCVADGMCVISCVAPKDPDCFFATVDYCQNDGVCDPSCPEIDIDCLPLCEIDGNCIRSCEEPDSDCVPGVCGNGVLDLDEECDDGNDIDLDGCRNGCIRPLCGDGVLDANEECEDSNQIETDDCVFCRVPFCGDGVVFSNLEECDDGNLIDGDGCSSRCIEEGAFFTGGGCSIENLSNTSSTKTLLAFLLPFFAFLIVRKRLLSLL